MNDQVAPSILSAEEVEALVSGYHGDTFRVLGGHQQEDRYLIRTFQPHAQRVSVIERQSGTRHKLTKVHEAGLFELLLEQTQYFDYSLELILTDGRSEQIEDPYAYRLIGRTGELYERLGAHLTTINGVSGSYFAVWAPNAERVSLVGNFNEWDGRRHGMRNRTEEGIWDIFMPGVGQGELYKYEIKTSYKGYLVNKTDPVGFFNELRPNTASVVWDIDTYDWQDSEWIESGRTASASYTAPMSVYEVHLGSWKRTGENGEKWLSYNQLADELVPYLTEMGYTHVELLPISEHPFDGSWGYQVTGYFAPTSRFGTPQEFMGFVDRCHQAGIGVILDWVPAHFPKDEHGLGFFDGTHLYEHADPRQGEHPDWGTKIFNFGRNEVREFLISNAIFWIEKYHIDGLRVDAVASMLYLDFSREPDQWIPNRYGGRENIEALEFIKQMNAAVHAKFPNALTIAEESTAWPGVTRSTEEGGLGFDLKWNMGWMNDTLRYFSTDPIYRSFHQGSLTFSLLYAFSEKYTLVFSHDEVVHLKKSMLDKMPGDLWQKFANLRLLYGYQYAHPGRKLNFMGNEFGQWAEWSEEKSLDWHLLDTDERHRGTQLLIQDLNQLYRTLPELHVTDDLWDGFNWIDFRDAQNSILIFSRQDPANPDDQIIVVCNFTPQVLNGYRIGLPEAGEYREILNTDHARYGGSGVVNAARINAAELPWQDQPYSIQLTLPPLGVIYLKRNI